MTREESIDVLEKMKYPQKVNKNGFVISNVDIENEALEMAIKTIRQVTEVRKLILQAEKSGVHLDYGAYKFMQALEKIVGEKQIGEYEQEPCDDAVSREAVLSLFDKSTFASWDLTLLERKIKVLPPVTQKSGKWDRLYRWLNDMRLGIAPDETVADDDERREREAQVDVLDDLMEVVEQMPGVAIPSAEPCGDCISRQAVIDSLHNKFADGFDSDRWWNSMSVLYAINKVPSVKPQEPKTGHWIRVTDNAGHLVWECDKCGWQQRYNTNFCPDCGCRMVEPQESEET